MDKKSEEKLALIKKEYAKYSNDIPKLPFDYETMFQSINKHFDREEEYIEKSDFEDILADVSLDLNLEDKADMLTYRQRLTEAIAEKLVLKIKDIVSNNKDKFNKDKYIDFLDKDLINYLSVEIKAPEYFKKGNTKINEILIRLVDKRTLLMLLPLASSPYIYETNFGNLSYNKEDETIHYTPLVYCEDDYKYSQTKKSRNEFNNFVKFEFILKLEGITNDIFNLINNSLKKEKLGLDYGLYVDPSDFIHPQFNKKVEINNPSCKKEYNFQYEWKNDKEYESEVEALNRFKLSENEEYVIPYFFRIYKK